MVVKRDGRREPFDSEKIRIGILKACEKRPIAADVQDKLVRTLRARCSILSLPK
jgi:transcriptional repressor NrdR